MNGGLLALEAGLELGEGDLGAGDDAAVLRVHCGPVGGG